MEKKQAVVGVYVRDPGGYMNPNRTKIIRSNHVRAVENAFGFKEDQIDLYMPIASFTTDTFGIGSVVDSIDKHLGEDGIFIVEFETGLHPQLKATAVRWLKPLMQRDKAITLARNGMFTHLGEKK